MANAREISTRIKSIQDTMKITKAMYMMSSMKLRKARQKLESTEPYLYGLHEQIADILLHFPDMQHLCFLCNLNITFHSKTPFLRFSFAYCICPIQDL